MRRLPVRLGDIRGMGSSIVPLCRRCGRRLAGNQWQARECRRKCEPLTQPLERSAVSVCRDRAKHLAVIEIQAAAFAPHSRVCLFKDCIEHRREVARRGIDDLQDLGGRGLWAAPRRARRCAVALRIARGKLPLQIGDDRLADRLTCCRASRSSADLVGTDRPWRGSYL